MTRMILLFFLTTFSFSSWAIDLSGALALEICPKNTDCFRKHAPVSPTINLSRIYEDPDLFIEYGSWDGTETVQSYEISGNIEVTKTHYKQSGDTYWEYISVVSHSASGSTAKTSYAFKEPTTFFGALTTIGQNVSNTGAIKRFPVFILAPTNFKLRLIE